MHAHDELEVIDVTVVGKFILDGTYLLELTFNDGRRKTVDVKPLLTGIHQRLLYHDQFAQARLETGTVVWPGDRIRPDQAHITDLRLEPAVLYALDPVD